MGLLGSIGNVLGSMFTSGKSRSQTTIPEPTAEEKGLMDMISNVMMPAQLEELGYEVTRKEIPLEESSAYKEKVKEIEQMESRMGGMHPQGQLAMLTRYNRAKDDLKKMVEEYEPEVEYSSRKKDSPKIESLRKRLKDKGYSDAEIEAGIEDDELYQEFQTAKEDFEGAKVERDERIQALHSKFLDVSEKYLKGDFSITEEQKALVAENFAPIRAAVTSMYDEARKQVSETEKDLLTTTRDVFNRYEEQIKQTGLDVGAALDLVGDQILQTGANMEGALKNVVSTNQELLKMGIEDYTGQITKQVSSNAAMLGRSPDDPEYSLEIQQLVARQVSSGQLNLAAMEAQGMLRISEQTGSKLEALGARRADLAERGGRALEQAALGRGQQELQIGERAGLSRQELARAQGAADVGMEEQIANLKWQVGAGMVPQQAQIGAGARQYEQALQQQRIQNAQLAMQAPSGVYGLMAGERYRQPTTIGQQKAPLIPMLAGLGISAASALSSSQGGGASPQYIPVPASSFGAQGLRNVK